jgi:hypothetical protein
MVTLDNCALGQCWGVWSFTAARGAVKCRGQRAEVIARYKAWLFEPEQADLGRRCPNYPAKTSPAGAPEPRYGDVFAAGGERLRIKAVTYGG